MKRILAIMLVVLAFVSSIPSQAQIYRGPNSAQEAQKAARKDKKGRPSASAKRIRNYGRRSAGPQSGQGTAHEAFATARVIPANV